MAVRRASITSALWRLAAVGVFALLANGVIVFWNLAAAERQEAEVQRVTRMLDALRALSLAVTEAESGQRGYLLTTDAIDRSAHEIATDAGRRLLIQLDSELIHPAARELFAEMKPLVDAKLDRLEATVRLAQERGFEAAVDKADDEEGRVLMQNFRQLDERIIEVEKALLEVRRQEFLDGLRRMAWIVLLAALLSAFALMLLARRAALQLQVPLKALLNALAETGRGQSGHRVHRESDDEIARIAEAFNGMAEQLEQTRQAQTAAQERLERSNAELTRSNSELDQFAYVASHDLKAPLRGIRSLAGWIGEDVGEAASPEVRENLGLLGSRVDRLDRLLDALLAYSRIGRKEAVIEDVELSAMVGEIADYIAPPPGFRIVWEGQPLAIRTWRAPLETVLRNLVSNALKHHDQSAGEVRVSVEEGEPGWLNIAVTDDGPGIGPQFHEKVFGMFQTLRPRDQMEGSGMGLAIVRKTVEYAGGRVELHSAPPARGSRFSFTWPRETERDDD